MDNNDNIFQFVVDPIKIKVQFPTCDSCRCFKFSVKQKKPKVAPHVMPNNDLGGVRPGEGLRTGSTKWEEAGQGAGT